MITVNNVEYQESWEDTLYLAILVNGEAVHDVELISVAYSYTAMLNKVRHWYAEYQEKPLSEVEIYTFSQIVEKLGKNNIHLAHVTWKLG